MSPAWQNTLVSVGNQYGATDLNVSVITGTSVTCPSSTNIFARVQDWGGNQLRGWNACNSSTDSGSHPNVRCTQQRVTVNVHYVTSPERRIWCHEMGHSMGLRHTSVSNSCLRRTADGGTSALLSSHDIAHLNAQY